MRILTLIVVFESVASQYNWIPYNYGFTSNPQQTFNRNYQPNDQQSSNLFYPQESGSFYGQLSNSYYTTPPNRVHTTPSYRVYPKQQKQNIFYPEPSNLNYPQSKDFLNILKQIQMQLEPSFRNVVMDNCEMSQGLIINGTNAKAGEFPHMAAVGYKDRNRVIHVICGGSLISDQFVLTAAHCKVYEGVQSSIVRLGVLNLKVKEQDSYEKDIAIDSFISHENYDPNRKKNDIAVIKLVSKVVLSKFIRPACLMTPNNPVDVQKAVVTGWGLTQAFTGQTSDILQIAELKIKDIRICRSYLDDVNVDSTQICAGDRGRDTCSGDSGGPLQIISPRNKCIHIIVGITSYGSQFCGAANSVAVYTKVSAYVDWIEQKVWGSGS